MSEEAVVVFVFFLEGSRVLGVLQSGSKHLSTSIHFATMYLSEFACIHLAFTRLYLTLPVFGSI